MQVTVRIAFCSNTSVYFIKRGEVNLLNEYGEKVVRYKVGDMFGDSDVLLHVSLAT